MVDPGGGFRRIAAGTALGVSFRVRHRVRKVPALVDAHLEQL
jgi:hypothetical protein